MSSYSVSSIHKRTPAAEDVLSDGYDIVIIFHSAEGLTKMNMAAQPNPYFVAKIDHQISFTRLLFRTLIRIRRDLFHCALARCYSTTSRSTTLPNASTPRWNNEEWTVRNVPLNAKLLVSIYDKNQEKVVDDSIGEFEILSISNYRAPSGGHAIIGSFGRHNGRFHLSIHAAKSSKESQQLPRYTFDGPCRYSRYDFVAADRRIMPNADCTDSIWKIQLRRISSYLPPDEQEQQSQQYKSSREAFNYYPFSLAAQNTMKLAHQVFDGRTLKQNENGRLTSADDLWKLIFLDRATQEIQPRAYNYIIDDSTWQFSEIGRRWLTDSEIKHTRLANSSECIRYAGEFHLRPKFGWNRWDDEWELVFDNASGTYSPKADLLVNLKKLLLFNFPGLNVITYDYKDPRLKESMEQLELASKKYKHSTTTTTISRRVLPYVSST